MKVTLNRLIAFHFVVLLCLALTGCGTVNQAFTAYGAVAIENARTTNDNLITAWATAACATPLSAALRNPQIIPALKALCVPAQETTGGALLDSLASGPVDYKIGKR